MKPFLHAKQSAKKYGGVFQDYLDIHEFIDMTKAALLDMRHRMVLHNAMGVYICAQVFGDVRKNSAGKDYSVRDVAEDHIIQDLGTLPTLERCFQSMKLETWMGGPKTRSPKKVISFEKVD